MPFIDTKTTVKITETEKEELSKIYAQAMQKNLSKSEQWLMLNFADQQRMIFASDSRTPAAILEVKILGSKQRDAYEALTAELCREVSKVLKIDASRIYVKYEEAELWGWNGSLF